MIKIKFSRTLTLQVMARGKSSVARPEECLFKCVFLIFLEQLWAHGKLSRKHRELPATTRLPQAPHNPPPRHTPPGGTFVPADEPPTTQN